MWQRQEGRARGDKSYQGSYNAQPQLSFPGEKYLASEKCHVDITLFHLMNAPTACTPSLESEKGKDLSLVCEVRELHPDPDRKGSFHMCCSCQVFPCRSELVQGGRRAFHAGLRKSDLPSECARLLTHGMQS